MAEKTKRRVIFHTPFYHKEHGLFRVDEEVDIPDDVVLPRRAGQVEYIRGSEEDQPDAKEHAEKAKQPKVEKTAPVDPRTGKPRRRRSAAKPSNG